MAVLKIHISTSSFGAGRGDARVLKMSSPGEIVDPGCTIVASSNATISDTNITPVDTNVTGTDTSCHGQLYLRNSH